MLSKILAAIGIGLLILASHFYIQAAQYERLNLQPLSMPVSLLPGTIKAPEFGTDFDYWDYEIALDWDAHAGAVRTGPMLIDISWQLFDGTNIAAKGNSQNPENGGPSEEPGILYERRIGSFRAQKGHQYRLVLQNNRDASDHNGTHPRIVVQIPTPYWDDHAMGVGFLKLYADCSGIIGLIALIGAFVRNRRQRRG
jgi:hypothetical protein